MRRRRSFPPAQVCRDRVLGAAALAALALYGLLCALAPGRPSTALVTGSWIGTLLLCSAFTCSRALALRDRDGPDKAFAVAVVCWTSGECLYLLYPGEVPFPSAADAMYLLFYPAVYVGLGRLLRSRVSTAALPTSIWLDGLIAVLAGGAVVAGLAFSPLLSTLGGDPLTIATNLAYPLGDLLLVLLAGALLVTAGRRAGLQWALLLAGFVTFGITDSVYLVQTALGTYVENTLLDPCWAVGLTLVAASSVVRPRTDPLPLTSAPSVVPVLGGLAATVVLLVGSSGHANLEAVGLAGAAVLMAFARLLLTLREVRRLVDVRRLALTDDLTGLPNRRALLQQVDAYIVREQACTLVLLDLDGFKELNDTLGHPAGDELLRRVGQLLRADLAPDELFTRLGGDEFALLCAGGDPWEGEVRARELLARLTESVLLDGVSVRIGASAGVAVFPGHTATTDGLLQAADVSMYQAKRSRTGVRVYRASDNHHSRDRLAMAAELVEGIEAGQLRLLYQPQVRLRDGLPLGVEALVRWQHPTHGLLTPDRFLPVVQATGIAPLLSDAVLRLAARQAVAWRHLGLPIAVNLFASDLLDPHLPERVAGALHLAGAVPADLHLEVTEDALMGDVARAIASLDALRSQGMHLSLDDFGQGHSSLARLRDLPLDELKIDRAFLWQEPHPSARTTSVLRAAVALADDLGLTVVAEGMEDLAIWDRLERLGCDTVQGFAVARPLTAVALEHWYASWPARCLGRQREAQPSL